jgi:UDP-N-acetylmuramoylalanine-D-glutamate ligase
MFDPERFAGRQHRTEQYRDRERLAFWGDPDATEPAATARLVEGDNGREIGFCAFGRERGEDVIGRYSFIEHS